MTSDYPGNKFCREEHAMFNLKRRVRDALHAHAHANTDVLHKYICEARIQEAEGRFVGHPHLTALLLLAIEATQPSKHAVHRVTHRFRMTNRRVVHFRPNRMEVDHDAVAT
ncbi:MAG TPA: hypothetical protein VEA92_01680 [Candidatus Paceibacterota bacterium]|nr:hypothetical protein [Candidatus Paceibacterota bacterium]